MSDEATSDQAKVSPAEADVKPVAKLPRKPLSADAKFGIALLAFVLAVGFLSLSIGVAAVVVSGHSSAKPDAAVDQDADVDVRPTPKAAPVPHVCPPSSGCECGTKRASRQFDVRCPYCRNTFTVDPNPAKPFGTAGDTPKAAQAATKGAVK